MISEEELNVKIEQVCDNYEGQLDDLYAAIGMVVMGRRYGSRVMRLIASRRHWRLMQDLFGDYHELMEDEGRCAGKSVGLRIVKEVGSYWKVVTGEAPTSSFERKAATKFFA